jgi:hypothetical protein
MRIQIWGFVDQKMQNFTAEKKSYFIDKNLQAYYPWASKNGRSSYRRSLQPSKENIQHLKT